MELLQLRYFLALAETENLTKTAQNLFISPSSLSLTISRLEKELGAQLFMRTGRNIVLNETGRMFAKYIRTALDSVDFAVAQVKEANAITILLDSPALWSKTLSDYMHAQPNICINTMVMRKKDITQDVLLNEFDFWLSSSAVVDGYDLLEKQQLTENNMCLAVPDTHPLASRASVSLKELKDENFLFPTKGYEFHNACMDMCHAGGFEPNIIANCGFLVRMKMISAGHGISFVNGKYEELFKHVVIVDIEENDNLPFDTVSILWHKGRKLSASAQSFLKYIMLYYQE